MDDSKWGSVNLDDDIPLDPENISEWYGVVSMVRGTFKGVGTLQIPTTRRQRNSMPIPSTSCF